jgi:hypothetical protein
VLAHFCFDFGFGSRTIQVPLTKNTSFCQLSPDKYSGSNTSPLFFSLLIAKRFKHTYLSNYYSFENTGFLFSRKALTASLRSSDLSIAAFHVATCSRPCCTVTSLLLSKTAFVPITAHADFSAISETIRHVQSNAVN